MTLRPQDQGTGLVGTAPGRSPRTRVKYETAVSMILDHPCVGVKLPRLPQTSMLFLSADEVRTLAEAIHPHVRVLIYVDAYTGLRAGELGALRRKRVDLLRGGLHVEEALKA